MTIQVEISPESKAHLAALSAMHGIDVGKYASKLLNTAIASESACFGVLTRQEFHAMLRELAEGSETLPKLPTSAFSRESIYAEHS